MTISNICIENLVANPYQTRLSENPEHIRQIAESIRQHGLLQIPTARLIPDGEGIWQLAFGHSRWAAFKLLYTETQANDWYSMPVQIITLTDQQMFELAVSENRDRKDLTPLEEARAMQVYRDQFHKTSAEIGQLFHLSDSSVRNKLRLLELPEAVQDQVGAGLSEKTAHRLLTLQAVSTPEKVVEMAKTLAEGGFETPEKVNDRLAFELGQDKNAVSMWGGYYGREGDPCGGAGLWPLAWTPGNLSTTVDQWNKALDARGLPKATKDDFWSAYLPAQTGQDVAACIRGTYPKDQASKAAEHLQCLACPPACTSCPFYMRLDGRHWCGFKTCWSRKRQAWLEAETRRLSKEMQILVYDPAVDGKEWADAESTTYVNGKYINFPWQKWLEAKDDHLRLRPEYQEYSEHKATGSRCVMLAVVGDEIKKARLEAKQREEEREQRDTSTQNRWALERKNRNDSENLIHKVVVPIFVRASLFQGTSAFLLWISSIFGMNREKLPTERVQLGMAIQSVMMEHWLNSSVTWQQKEHGPALVADYIESLAVTLGVKLPADWIDQVREFAPEYGKQEAEVTNG